MTKNPVCRTPCREPCIIWSSFLVQKYIIVISPSFSFFIFSKFWFLRVNGQKMVQNDKKLFPLCLISQEPYLIWSSFMVPGVYSSRPQIFYQSSKLNLELSFETKSLKLVFAIFYQICIFSPNNSPLKTMKNVFYSI